jgi:FixJ family two-component response regulator
MPGRSDREFLAALPGGLPECLIVDLQMPAKNGFELQQHLVSNGITIPTILITAYGDVALRDHTGPVADLQKLSQQQALFEAIDGAVRSSRSAG